MRPAIPLVMTNPAYSSSPHYRPWVTHRAESHHDSALRAIRIDGRSWGVERSEMFVEEPDWDRTFAA